MRVAKINAGRAHSKVHDTVVESGRKADTGELHVFGLHLSLFSFVPRAKKGEADSLEVRLGS